jgi:hypothetical protein
VKGSIKITLNPYMRDDEIMVGPKLYEQFKKLPGGPDPALPVFPLSPCPDNWCSCCALNCAVQRVVSGVCQTCEHAVSEHKAKEWRALDRPAGTRTHCPHGYHTDWQCPECLREGGHYFNADDIRFASDALPLVAADETSKKPTK